MTVVCTKECKREDTCKVFRLLDVKIGVSNFNNISAIKTQSVNFIVIAMPCSTSYCVPDNKKISLG